MGIWTAACHARLIGSSRKPGNVPGYCSDLK
jgi:hypothetical protein